MDDRELDHAVALLNAGQPEHVIQRMSAYLTQDPDEPRALALLAHAFTEVGQNESAVDAAQAAVTRAPDYAYGYALLSIARENLREYPEARAAALTAQHLNPTDWSAQLRVASVDIQRELSSDEGRAAVSEALRLAPDLAATHFMAGSYALLEKKKSAARAAYREALRIEPQNVEAKRMLALMAADGGRALVATPDLIDGMIEQPNSPVALVGLRIAVTSNLGALSVVLFIAIQFLVSPVGKLVFGYDTVSPADDYPPVIARVITAVVALAFTAGFLVSLRLRLGSRFSTVSRSLPSIYRVATAWAIGLAVGLALFFVAIFVPPAIALMIYRLTGFGIAIIAVINFVRLRRQVKALGA